MDLQIIIFALAGLPRECSRAFPEHSPSIPGAFPRTSRAGMLGEWSKNARNMRGSTPRAAPQGSRQLACRIPDSVKFAPYNSKDEGGFPRCCPPPPAEQGSPDFLLFGPYTKARNHVQYRRRSTAASCIREVGRTHTQIRSHQSCPVAPAGLFRLL